MQNLFNKNFPLHHGVRKVEKLCDQMKLGGRKCNEVNGVRNTLCISQTNN